jgi:hypothetical protein
MVSVDMNSTLFDVVVKGCDKIYRRLSLTLATTRFSRWLVMHAIPYINVTSGDIQEVDALVCSSRC